MIRFWFSAIIDGAFTFFTTFLISFVLFNYFLSSKYALVFSLVTASLCTLIFIMYIRNKNYKSRLKKADRTLKEKVINQLNLSSQRTLNTLFFKAFTNLNYAVEMKKQGVFLTESKTLIYPCFSFDEIRKSDIIKAYAKINNSEKAMVLSSTFSPEIKSFALSFNEKIILKDGAEVFEALKRADTFPEITVVLQKQNPTKRQILKDFFAKKRALGYFLLGSAFLALSFLVSFKIYYVTIGSFLMLFSLLCRFFGYKKETVEN